MNLTTARLVMRPFRPNDGDDLYAYLSDPEVVRYEPYKPFTREGARGEACRRAENEHFIAVCLKNGRLIGNLYFAEEAFESWEIGYVFCREFWGKGYAAEAVTALIEEAFQVMGVHRIVGNCDQKNVASWRLLERAGLRREGAFTQNVFFFKDENDAPLWTDTYAYALLRTEYLLKNGEEN